jgi:hypothetical protein
VKLVHLVGFIIKTNDYVVYSCLIVSWLLAVQTSIAYDRNWILSYNMYVVSCLCGVHWETVRGFLSYCVC